MKSSTETLLLSLALTIGLSGCGKGQQKESGNSSQNTGNTQKTLKMDTAQQHPIDIESLPTGQLPEDTVRIIPYRKGKQWVFVDRNKEMVIPQIYEEAMPFNEHGLAAVKQNGKMGFIDRHGKVVVPIVYDLKGFGLQFMEERIPLYKGGKACLIDLKGKEVVPPGQYDDIGYFYLGQTTVEKEGKYGIIDLKGNEIIPPIYEDISQKSDFDGKPVVAATMDGKTGFLNHQGEKFIDFIYDFVGEFSEGYAMARKQDEKRGFIDRNGQMVIPPRYIDAYRFQEGLAAVKWDENWGVIDAQGKTVISNEFEELGAVFEDGLIAARKNEKWGVIDKNGKTVVPFTSSRMPELKEGLIGWESGGKYGVLDYEGKEIIPFIYDGGKYGLGLRILTGNLIKVTQGNLSGIVDRKHNTVIPIRYANIADEFYGNGMLNGLIGVTTLSKEGEKKEGFLTLDGTEYFED